MQKAQIISPIRHVSKIEAIYERHMCDDTIKHSMENYNENNVGKCWETLWRCREKADGLKSFPSEVLFQCQDSPLRVAIAGNQLAIVGTLENAIILGRYGCVMLSYDAYSTSIQNAWI